MMVYFCLVIFHCTATTKNDTIINAIFMKSHIEFGSEILSGLIQFLENASTMYKRYNG